MLHCWDWKCQLSAICYLWCYVINVYVFAPHALFLPRDLHVGYLRTVSKSSQLTYMLDIYLQSYLLTYMFYNCLRNYRWYCYGHIIQLLLQKIYFSKQTQRVVHSNMQNDQFIGWSSSLFLKEIESHPLILIILVDLTYYHSKWGRISPLQQIMR